MMHFDWWTLALQTVNFAVLVWLLHRFLYKPVLQLVDARRAEVQQQYDAAKAAEKETAVLRAAAEAEEARIAASREMALKAADAQAAEAAKTRKAQAEREAAALLDATHKALATERDQALAEARRAALDLGTEIARRLLAEVPMTFRAEAWLQRIEQHLATVETDERDGLRKQLADGATLQVVTAAPLPAETTERWRSCLHQSLGDHVVLVFEVDPKLVAGTELHFPNAVLRVSWQSELTALRSEIEAHANAR